MLYLVTAVSRRRGVLDVALGQDAEAAGLQTLQLDAEHPPAVLIFGGAPPLGVVQSQALQALHVVGGEGGHDVAQSLRCVLGQEASVGHVLKEKEIGQEVKAHLVEPNLSLVLAFLVGLWTARGALLHHQIEVALIDHVAGLVFGQLRLDGGAIEQSWLGEHVEGALPLVLQVEAVDSKVRLLLGLGRGEWVVVCGLVDLGPLFK